MKEYKIHPGIVLTEIHGVYLIVADKQARQICPYIQRINKTGAIIFKEIEEKKDIDEIANQLSEEYDIPDISTLKDEVISFIELLEEKHYLIWR